MHFHVISYCSMLAVVSNFAFGLVLRRRFRPCLQPGPPLHV